MFVSMNWIKDFVDLEGQDLEKLIHRFTLSTAEVEDIEYKGRDIKEVVVGEILSCENHPDSDHLHVLKVDAGDQIYDVVCGASNARAGLKTAFCRLGGQVGDLKIKSTKLRGCVSNGMCCSEKEIGISDNHDGIMELDAALVNGTDLKALYPIEDLVFEVDNKSLTNRPDLWGHYGMAREFAALTNQHMKELPVMENDYTGENEVDISITNQALAYRYTSVRIENITRQVSPMEMKIRLFYCGTRAINLLADLTNYLMLELGQPMHAFDGTKIEKIVVGTPEQNFRFTTLDGTEREITPDTLMIYNDKTPVAIAGIMGGLDSEITDRTNSVVLESANFDGISIRKSASRLTLRTDASARYEKTLDPEMTMLAVKRFMKLLKDADPDCHAVSKISDVYVYQYPKLSVQFDKHFVDRYTGIDISCERIRLTLEQLGFATEQNGEEFVTAVPSWRATKDVSMKADIIEEITRIYGYDNFAVKTTLSPLLPAKTSERRKEENLIKDILVKMFAMNEVHTRVWCDPDALRNIGLMPEDNVRILGNTDENGILRTSFMQSFLPLIYNNRNYAPSFGIFEIGRIVSGVREDGTARERRMLGVAIYSKETAEKSLYIKAVQIVNTIVNQLKHKKAEYTKIQPEHIWQHPKNTAGIVLDTTAIGNLYTLHPKTLGKISKNGSVVCIEIDMDALLKVEATVLQFAEPSRFPTVEYDLSLLLPEGVRFGAISECWSKLFKKHLKEVSVIDIYDAETVKSVTVRFSFGLDDRTLTGEEVQKSIDSILANLETIGVKMKS